MYKAIPHLVMVSLGLHVTSVIERRETVVFEEPIYCKLLERELAPGVCVGTRMIIEVRSEEGVTATATIEPRLFRPGEVEHTLWEVDGLPFSRIRVERENQAHYTASSLFNRVRDVIAAPPGIMTVAQMGLMRNTALE